MMETNVHDPAASWRDYQRVSFIKGFYKARQAVLELFDEFQRTGDIPAELVDRLLETSLRDLKDLSRVLYHIEDEQETAYKQQRIFNKVLSELCHEAEKARDNIRIVEAYSEEANLSNDKVLKKLSMLDKQIVNSARRELPVQFRRIKRIMDVLGPLFEQILPVYRDNRVVTRTLYFDRERFDRLVQPSTIEFFFPILFGSVAEGYLELIHFLVRTSHLQQSLDVMVEFGSWIESHPKDRPFFDRAEATLQAAQET